MQEENQTKDQKIQKILQKTAQKNSQDQKVAKAKQKKQEPQIWGQEENH